MMKKTRLELDIIFFLTEKGLLNEDCTEFFITGDFGKITLNQLLVDYIERRRKQKIEIEKQESNKNQSKINTKVVEFYNFLCGEKAFLRNKLKQEILKAEESKAVETKKELIELDTILKFFDSLQGRFTDPQEGNYKTPQESKLVLCVSYIQEHAKERNIKNISFDLEELPTVDQFPAIEQVQEQLEKEMGFPVTDVVLISWGRV